MRAMLGNAIGAVDAEYPAFGETVEGEDVVVGQAAKLHIIAVHEVEEVDARLHLLLLVVEIVSHDIDVPDEIVILGGVLGYRSPQLTLPRLIDPQLGSIRILIGCNASTDVIFLIGAVVGCLLLIFALLLRPHEYNIQLSRTILGNIMSLFHFPTLEPPNDPLQLYFYNISKIMRFEFMAEEVYVNQGVLYRSLIMISQRRIELFWRFEPVKDNNFKVYIRPNLSDGVAGNFRVETQRGFVDLLRIINNCNKDKSKSMSFLINEFNFVEMCTLFSVNFLKDTKLLSRAIKATLMQLPQVLGRLLTALKPFLETSSLLQQSQSLTGTAKVFLEKSYQFLLLSKFNQIKSQDELQNLKEESHSLKSREQILKKMQQSQGEAFKKVKQCFKILGVGDTFLRENRKPAFFQFTQWIRNRSQAQKNKIKQPKNISGIKILEEISKSIDKEREGTHCKVIVSKLKVVIMISLNVSVNKNLSEMKNKEGQPLIKQKVLRVQKQIEIVRKTVKVPQKLQALNSLENELDFMLYIKQRRCKYVTAYFWQYQKKREQMNEILMEYYPHNLREMLHSQGKLLSFREKLILAKRIAAAINWLANQYVCHRDIKPDNIMISEHRIPKLIDFGSCCPVYGIGNQYFLVKETRLLGTPRYYSPYSQNVCFTYRRAEYEQHILFDSFSLGRVLRDIFEDQLPHLLPNLEGLMNYIIERCEEEAPNNRLTYQQILFLLDSFLSYLE